MSYLNSDLPHFYGLLRREYLYNLETHHGEYEPVSVFGMASIPGRAVMFHCLTETGAQIGRLPISAFCWKPCEAMALDVLCLWNSFSYRPSVIEYEYLRGLRCCAYLKDGKAYWGQYMFTIDWFGSPYSEDPGEGGWKCGHVLRLDNGCFAIQPNNRIGWLEPSFVTKPFALGDGKPDYKTNSHIWNAESSGLKWATEDSSAQFYKLEVEQANQ